MTNHFFELLLALTEKEIKARYKHAVLGFLWIFINPLIQMIVMGFVFSLIFRFGVENYYLFLFTGLLPWNFFSLALNKATPRIVWDRSLIQKAKFPREVIPLSMVLSHFFHFAISWLMLIIFLLVTRQFQFFKLSIISSQLFAIILLFIFTSGLSLITSALTVFFSRYQLCHSSSSNALVLFNSHYLPSHGCPPKILAHLLFKSLINYLCFTTKTFSAYSPSSQSSCQPYFNYPFNFNCRMVVF